MSQRPDLVPLLIILIPITIAAAVLIWMERRERPANGEVRSLALLIDAVLNWRPHNLSSSDGALGANAVDTEPIHVSVLSIDTAAPTPADRVGAHTDAVNGNMGNEGWELPRGSRHISDGELIVLLAALRGKDGKHRFSANQIARLVGGSHNDVMKRVNELRADAPPVVFRPLTPEQRAAREQLQLDQP